MLMNGSRQADNRSGLSLVTLRRTLPQPEVDFRRMNGRAAEAERSSPLILAPTLPPIAIALLLVGADTRVKIGKLELLLWPEPCRTCA